MVPSRAPLVSIFFVNGNSCIDDSLLVDDTSFDLAKERGNSTILRRYKVSNPELISRVVDFLYDELVEHTRAVSVDTSPILMAITGKWLGAQCLSLQKMVK